MKQNEDLLRAALLGYHTQLTAITGKINEINLILTPRLTPRRTRKSTKMSSKPTGPAEPAPAPAPSPAQAPAQAPAKRRMSAEGRARIAAAQKKRWSNIRKVARTPHQVLRKTA